MFIESKFIHAIVYLGAFSVLTSVARAVIVSVPAVEDTFLVENSTANAGGHSHVAVGTANNGSSRRGLFQFDVSLLVPAGATINSVTLDIDVLQRGNSPVDHIINLQALNADWGEGIGTGNNGRAAIGNEANWNDSFSGAVSWGMAGGDFSSSVLSASFIDGTGNFTFASGSSFVARVQSMLDNPTTNFGFALVASNESVSGTALRVGSREGSSPAMLVIDFTPVPEPSSALLLVASSALLFRRRR